MSELKLKNVFFNDSTDPNSEAKHIFDEVNESLKDHPISSVKNLKKYFRLLAKKFAENLNRELAHIFNHPNILDYKNVSFDPHSRAEYKNEKSSSFYHLDCDHEDAESENKDDAALSFKLYFNIPIKQLPEIENKTLIELERLLYWHVEEMKMHIVCPMTQKTLYTYLHYLINKKKHQNIKTVIKIDMEQKQLKVELTNGC